MKSKPFFNQLLFGSSVAMSWVWGLGLFFSVQFAFQFGVTGLLSFAIPNALGLFLFGYGTERLSKKHNNLEAFFFKWSKPYSGVIYFYQLLAITLTFFAIARYLILPLVPSASLFVFPLIVVLLVILAVFMGEQFPITKIKKSHFALFIVALAALAFLFNNTNFEVTNFSTFYGGHDTSGMYWGYLLPIVAGFLVGPWLDIQQWQRAIQMEKEQTSIVKSYVFGAILFFSIIVAHGMLAIAIVQLHTFEFVSVGKDGFYYAHAVLTHFFADNTTALSIYVVFILACIITTLDSGYVALKWYLKTIFKDNKSVLLTIVPQQLISAPFLHLFIASLFALIGVYLEFELIYFIVFYGSFFVVYSVQAIAKAFGVLEKHPDMRMLSVAIGSVVIAALGYFLSMPFLLSASAFISVVLGVLLGEHSLLEIAKEEANDIVRAEKTPVVPANTVSNTNNSVVLTSEGVEGKWYVYSFTPTYYDTNSVGNVYYAMYAVWVGKARELFFNHCLPHFDLKNTDYYILTRKFEHKYINEAKEFDQVQVKIRVKNYNRKFATLEHKVFTNGSLAGRGEQSLLFVSSKSYEPVDIPSEIITGLVNFL